MTYEEARDIMLRMAGEAFDSAAFQFRNDTKAENWRKLEMAMYAKQGLAPGGVITRSDICHIRDTATVPCWVEALCDLIRGYQGAAAPAREPAYLQTFGAAEWENFAGAEYFREGVTADPPMFASVGAYMVIAARDYVEVHVAGESDVWQLCLEPKPKAVVVAVAEAFAEELSLTFTYAAAKQLFFRWGFGLN